jgi:glycosyltransferase involved in cell wall biosynthesis
MHKVLQVLDPSHENWVLGGIFRDLREEDTRFYSNPILLPPPNSSKNLFRWIKYKKQISSHPTLFFSSLTVLVNYSKFYKIKNQNIGLWFTHKEGNFTKIEIKALRSCNVIFVHSRLAKKQLKSIHIDVKIIVVIGAIDLKRFPRPATFGKGIIWIGTPSERKNPQLFLDVVRNLPDFRFVLLGNGWLKHKLSLTFSSFSNLCYKEISEALTIRDFDENSIILITSRLEGGPMPLLEAMAAGLTPIYTDCGFAQDLMDFLGKEFKPTNAHCGAFISAIREQMYELEQVQNNERHQKITQLNFRRLADLILNELI